MEHRDLLFVRLQLLERASEPTRFSREKKKRGDPVLLVGPIEKAQRRRELDSQIAVGVQPLATFCDLFQSFGVEEHVA